MTINLNPAINLDDDKKKYQLRLLNAYIVYCMPNVTTLNNTLKYTFSGNTYSSVFDTGLYSLEDINAEISMYTSLAGNGKLNSIFHRPRNIKNGSILGSDEKCLNLKNSFNSIIPEK